MCRADPACVLPAHPGEMCQHHARMFSDLRSGSPGRSSLPLPRDGDSLDGISNIGRASKYSPDELRAARTFSYPWKSDILPDFNRR